MILVKIIQLLVDISKEKYPDFFRFSEKELTARELRKQSMFTGHVFCLPGAFINNDECMLLKFAKVFITHTRMMYCGAK